jgi:transposase
MRQPLRVTGLRGRQQARLCNLYRTTDCPRTRLRVQMVLLSSDSHSVAEIAALTRQSDDTVARWLKRFLTDGWRGLLEGPPAGRQATITPAVEQFLSECLQRTPQHFRIARPSWTTALLAQVVWQRLKIDVTAECIRQHLERLEGVCRRPTWTVKYLARQKPGYAQKKTGLHGFCSIRRVEPLRASMSKMTPNSACSQRSRACGLAYWPCAACNARSARLGFIHPSGMNVRQQTGVRARLCASDPNNGMLTPSVGWSRNARRVRPNASGG